MNSITSADAQEQSALTSAIFPQALRIKLTGLSKPAASNLILDLFDAGAVPADLAESWLTALENLHTNS